MTAASSRSAAQGAQRWTTIIDGHQLRQLRRQHGLSQEQLAWQTGVSRATIVRLERQFRVRCRGRTLARLTAALGEPTSAISASPAHDSRPATLKDPGPVLIFTRQMAGVPGHAPARDARPRSADLTPDEAERFYEKDEDPAQVQALFDGAEREGRLRLTEPPPGQIELGAGLA